MTLFKVEARNPQGALLTLELGDETAGLLVKDISGLDPVKATINSTRFAQQDGEEYNSSSREKRNIIAKLGLRPYNWDMSPTDLRDTLYDFFMTDAAVELRFYTGSIVVNSSGRVESFDAPLFAKDPEASLSIICFDPDFIELEAQEISGNSVSTTVETLLTYPGTAKTGFIFKLLINRSLTDFSVYLRSPDGTTRQMDITGTFVSGDVVTINTQKGEKAVQLTHSGTTSDVLYILSRQSPYLTLSKGDNYLRVYATGAAIPYTLDYTTRYGGL